MDGKDPDAGMLHTHAAVGLEARGQRKLTVLLFTHSILTCACAAICVYTLYKETWRQTPQPVDKGIYLNMRKDPNSPYLNFTVTWSNSMTLEYGSEITVPIAGPYVFYICALVDNKGEGEGKGNLTLSQGDRNITTELLATSGTRCERYQRLISLYEKEKVTFSFKNSFDPYLYLKYLRVGLLCLLGDTDFKAAEFDPEE